MIKESKLDYMPENPLDRGSQSDEQQISLDIKKASKLSVAESENSISLEITKSIDPRRNSCIVSSSPGNKQKKALKPKRLKKKTRLVKQKDLKPENKEHARCDYIP